MAPTTCRSCNTSFSLSPEEKKGYEKFGFDPVPECFQCQQMHKLTFRNGRSLYKRTCDATGKPMVSIYAPDSPYKVYNRDYWYGDDWDPMEYGQEIDWSRPFFDQLKELELRVPRMGLLNVNPDNSDYCNMCVGNKDCYCVFGGDYNEAVLYGVLGMKSRNCVDVDYSNHNEVCHDLFNSYHCYGCRSVVGSKNCSDCAYVSDCMSCRDCILCVNLIKKQYCIENKQLSKEDYAKEKKKFLDGSFGTHMKNLQKFRDMRGARIVKFVHTISCENCTGDFMENSKCCQNTFFCADSQDVTDAVFVSDVRDCFRCSFTGHKTELCYDCMSTVLATSCRHCFFAFESLDCDYCDTVSHCKNCFGCSNMRHKQYCILNKQYTKEEYEKLRDKLITHMKKHGEWGEFFPKDIGCFAYNESTAMDFYPLTKKEALQKGFRWRDQGKEQAEVARVISAKELPDGIKDIPDDVLEWAIRCERTGRPFRLIKQELAFYLEHGIPLPRLHPDERYTDRMRAYRNPPILFDRDCMNCGKNVRSTYAPERTEKVYCERCYLEAVY